MYLLPLSPRQIVKFHIDPPKLERTCDSCYVFFVNPSSALGTVDADTRKYPKDEGGRAS